jgi:hypothetical protein
MEVQNTSKVRPRHQISGLSGEYSGIALSTKRCLFLYPPLSIFIYSGFRKQFNPHFITRPVPEAALGQIQLARKLKIIYN